MSDVETHLLHPRQDAYYEMFLIMERDSDRTTLVARQHPRTGHPIGVIVSTPRFDAWANGMPIRKAFSDQPPAVIAFLRGDPRFLDQLPKSPANP
jgi:hypothetical protein